MQDVLLHLGQVALGVDEVEVEELPQRLERLEGAVLERLVALATQVRVQVGDALLMQFTNAALSPLPIVLLDVVSAYQLPLDTNLFAYKEQRNAEQRLAEV